jgi:hypothetical protein
MTRAPIRILAFAAMASLPLLAQQPPSPNPQPPTESSPQATSPQQTNPEPGASQNAVPVPSTANSPEVANPELRPVTGELENKLDTKTSKTGDSVVVKTTQAAKTANGVEIPKGSRIVGHIVDVAAKGQDGENSRMTIQFDQAQIKGGQTVPIRSVIQSVALPGAEAGPNAAGGPAAPNPSGGGAMTPAQPNGNTGSPSQTPSQANPAQNSTESGNPGPAQAGGPPAPGTVVATKGNIAIRTTSIPGVLLIGSVSGRPFSNAAGALLGARQDVRLDNGTVMVVAIAAAPPGVPGH